MTVLITVACAAVPLALLHLLYRRLRLSRLPGATGDMSYTLYEAAFLSGGPARVADTVICVMRDKKRITVKGGTVRVGQPIADDDLERQLLTVCSDWKVPLKTVRSALIYSPPVQRVGDRLSERGLMWPPQLWRPWRRAARINMFVAIDGLFIGALGLIFSDSPLTLWLLIGSGLALGIGTTLAPRLLDSGRLTDSGRALLVEMRRGEPFPGGGMAGLMAVGGTVALTDAALRAQLANPAAAAPIPASSSASSTASWGGGCGGGGFGHDGGGGSDGGGGGGSSCGGGGCGGGGGS
ncbi:TIGR04222 domain-containing membrane protein [Streptomyces radicis]|uniref:TIGR04222 domain-containing membrane protein n=1 Tax=Streptomyces radicis TaxID=1750517 RepID=A0A3A9VTN3_9ACTN|nr:TIGR04222 domain-containing membrane protein [Streptomyces radicis]RKN04090.1 TIGR04222 domain-containing membrane protein [Streptomyces radicis]RKN14429.1 TIGR04222 domain-containing membrane protein [Streptomyces radicis]